MIGVFVSLDLLLFYLFFEASLVPMFFLIGIWGGERRIYAAVKFFIYTAVGSLLMLVGDHRALFHLCDTFRLSDASPGACRQAPFPRPTEYFLFAGLRTRVLHQGSALPVPHLVAGCTHGSSYCGFSDSRRRSIEDGNVRSAALQSRVLSRVRAASLRRTSSCSRSSASSTARSSRWSNPT